MGVVDAGLKIRFIDDLARRYLAGPNSGLFSMRSGPYAGSGVYGAAMSREEAGVRRRLVASATSGGTGGAMRVTSRNGAVGALMVTPAPQGLANDVSGIDYGGAREPLALLILRPLNGKVAPQAEMLCEMFGFSRAEAEVAVTLAGGASAEDVARGLAHDGPQQDPFDPGQVGSGEPARLRTHHGDPRRTRATAALLGVRPARRSARVPRRQF